MWLGSHGLTISKTRLRWPISRETDWEVTVPLGWRPSSFCIWSSSVNFPSKSLCRIPHCTDPRLAPRAVRPPCYHGCLNSCRMWADLKRKSARRCEERLATCGTRASQKRGHRSLTGPSRMQPDISLAWQKGLSSLDESTYCTDMRLTFVDRVRDHNVFSHFPFCHCAGEIRLGNDSPPSSSPFTVLE